MYFDYIIVGGGSAGCVMANKLSANKKNRVLLLEAGPKDSSFWLKTPIGYGHTFFDKKHNWRYYTKAESALNQRQIYCPRGKVLGGSSAINALVYCRGLADDYNDWYQAGNPGWQWSDVEKIFNQFERHHFANGQQKGNGALSIAHRFDEYHPIKDYFLAAAKVIGLPSCLDINGKQVEGVTGYPITTKKGWRCSSADAFLTPVSKRSNLTIKTNALTKRIVFTDKKASAVIYQQSGKDITAYANSEIIVCAGAINTPQLLQLSGIGPPQLLKRFAIDVVYGNEAVGGNLQDHLGINYGFKSKEKTLNQTLGTLSGRLYAAWRYLYQRSGPLSLSVNQMGGLVRTDAKQSKANIQLYFNPLSYSVTQKNKRHLLKPDKYPGFSLGFNPCRPLSRGRVDIQSNDIHQAPNIVANYLSVEQDIEAVLACAHLIAKLQQTKALQSLINGVIDFDLSKASDDEIIKDFRRRSASVFHFCGSCRMAPEKDKGVVDNQLKVYGVKQLRVVDASIFPNITSANTNAPAIMVAHMAAKIINHAHH